jgi:coproporphyrinogen III oxidase
MWDVSFMLLNTKKYLLELQSTFCRFLEQEEGQSCFLTDPWTHPIGGGGITKVLSNGAVIEKAGVNFSHIIGKKLPQAASLKRPDFEEASFEAAGVSVIVHPRNPYVPTAHFNIRFIVVKKQDHTAHWWFGGGFDLTPYYGFEEDCIHWHTTAKAACAPFGEEVYPTFKKWCDQYFYLKHRNEPRGIGGLFFDDLNEWGFERSFEFIKNMGTHFIKAYQPIMNKRKKMIYTERERQFQQYRRGRYVEFNLLYDRGTLFGLQSQGRTESILISLPPSVAWQYHWELAENSPEENLYKQFLIEREWV